MLGTLVAAAQFRGLAGAPLSPGTPGLPPPDSPDTLLAVSLDGDASSIVVGAQL